MAVSRFIVNSSIRSAPSASWAWLEYAQIEPVATANPHADHNEHAQEFWVGTGDPDVGQNIDTLPQRINAPPALMQA